MRRSRSIVRGPKRSSPVRSRPSRRSTSSRRARRSPAARSVSSAAAPFRNRGWSRQPTGSVSRSRETATTSIPGSAPRSSTALRIAPSRSPRLAPRPTYALTRPGPERASPVGTLDGRRRELHRGVQLHLRLADANAHARRRETAQELVGDGRREGLDQVEAPLLAELSHAGDDGRVVDRVRELVAAHSGVVGDHQDVEDERLPTLPLLGKHAVEPPDLQPLDFDRHLAHRTTDLAAASASTCSRTSWTRKREAPRSYARTATATLAATGPVSASGSPRSRPRKRLREAPTSTGRPRATSSSRRARSSRLCSTVLPKPIPGSRQIRSSGIPAATAKASLSSRKAHTSATTSS